MHKSAWRVLFLVFAVQLPSSTFRTEASAGQNGRIAPEKRKTSYDKPGPFGVKTLEYRGLKDAKRNNRPVPIKIHYPDADGPFPLVIVSHGGGGTWDANVYQARHLAGHGYVVFCVEHVYSNADRVKFYMTRRGGRMTFTQALIRTLTDPKVVLGRPKDVSFAIDRAIVWNRTNQELKGKINAGKVAVMGHSYGAYTTLVSCGARPILDYLDPPGNPPRGLAADLSDSRVTFGFAMSPQAPGGTRFSNKSFKTINRPVVCLTGSGDISQIYRQGPDKGLMMPATSRLETFKLLPAGRKYFLWLRNADHACFSDSPRAWIFPSEARVDAQRISRAMMAAFCNYYLKQDRTATACLNAEYVNSLCGEVITKVAWLEKDADAADLYPRSITHGGLERTYRLYVPSAFGKAKSMPLVIVLHGGGGTGERMEHLTLGGFNKLADRDGFVVAYPDGLGRAWNDGRKKTIKRRAHLEKVDDVGFVSGLIDHLSKDLNIDSKRVYVTGISNGAMMSFRLACDLSGKIAAIAAVAGSLPGELAGTAPARPVPVLILNNTKDPMMPYDGGDIRFGKLVLGKVLSTPDTVKFWVRHNASHPRPVTTRMPDTDPRDGTRVRREVYAAGKAGAAVVLYVIEGGGHTWPGGRQYLPERFIGRTCRDIDASEIIWGFFKMHTR